MSQLHVGACVVYSVNFMAPLKCTVLDITELLMGYEAVLQDMYVCMYTLCVYVISL